MSVLDDENDSKLEDNFDNDAFALQREITAENALIEDTFTSNRTDFVTISYGVTERNRPMQMRVDFDQAHS
jgi:hypothetical protein